MSSPKEKLNKKTRMDGENMGYETIKKQLAGCRQSKRRKSMDANPLSEQQIAELSREVQELKKLVYKVAEEKGIQLDDGMEALDRELAKYGYSQEKPNVPLADQEQKHTVPAKEMTGDSSYDRYGKLGKEIARKYNPHYKR